MNVPDSGDRARSRLRKTLKVARFSLVLLCATVAASGIGLAGAQQAKPLNPGSPVPLSAEQVVRNLVYMNRQRAEALHTFEGTRTYHVEYRGFPGSRSAEMVVAVKYQAAPATERVHGPVVDRVETHNRQGIRETTRG